ncbi:hypothetical protein ACFL1L_05110 [Thermoplasmatota archaeon]
MICKICDVNEIDKPDGICIDCNIKFDEKMKRIWKAIYEDEINIFDNETCNSCRKDIQIRAKMSHPVPLPYVGKDFFQDENNILFAGIESYGGLELKEKQNPKYDPFTLNRMNELYFELDKDKKGRRKYYPFWRWVRTISEEIIGKEDDSFHSIAYSNLLKCQARTYNLDDNEWECFESLCENCIKEIRWIHEEIKYLNPKNVVIFSGIGFDYYLAEMLLDGVRPIDIIDKENKITSRKLLFTDFIQGDQRYIITNHPRYSNQIIKERIIDILSN